MKSIPLTTKVVSSNPPNGEVYTIQHFMIKFVVDLRQVGCFPLGNPVFSTNNTDIYDITEILLQMALKHHTLNPY